MRLLVCGRYILCARLCIEVHGPIVMYVRAQYLSYSAGSKSCPDTSCSQNMYTVGQPATRVCRRSFRGMCPWLAAAISLAHPLLATHAPKYPPYSHLSTANNHGSTNLDLMHAEQLPSLCTSFRVRVHPPSGATLMPNRPPHHPHHCTAPSTQIRLVYSPPEIPP